MKIFHLFAVLLVCFVSSAARAQDHKLTVMSATFEPAKVVVGSQATLVVKMAVDPGWHIYTVAPHSSQRPTAVDFKTKGVKLAGTIKEPKPHVQNTNYGDVYYWHDGEFQFRIPLQFDSSLAGKKKIRCAISYDACTKEACLDRMTLPFQAEIMLGNDGTGSSAGSSNPNAADLSATAIKQIVFQLKETIGEGQDELKERINELEENFEEKFAELNPRKEKAETAAPLWEPGNVKVAMSDVKTRAGERARGKITFQTEEKVKLEKASEIFIDYGDSARVKEVEAIATKSSKDGLNHEIQFEIVAKDLAKSGAESVSLNFAVPMDRQGLAFEKELDGVQADLTFGLPNMWAWVLKAVVAALLALLTPCVFPMIPVTVSFFTKQAEKEHQNPAVLPTVYVLGIVVSFVVIGTAFTLLFGKNGAQHLATNGWIQGFFGLLFVVFSLSLFGMFTLRPPSFLMAKAGAVQGKGGIAGTLGMGLLFSLTSFTCTAPLVGLILVDAAESGEWQFPIVGMFAFSLILSIPFFFLAMFPRLMKSMPKSGGWMNRVKATLGFLELAFALKFIGAMDAYFAWGIFTRTSILWMWVIIFLMNAFYLLGSINFAHDMKPEKVGGIGGAFAISLLVLGLYTMQGANGAPMPFIMESLLPPNLESEGDGGVLGWKNHIKDNPELAFALAKEQGVPVFIDFTGNT